MSKLKRFHAHDINDIEAMVERDLVPHAQLIDRFQSAVSAFEMDDRAETQLPRYVDQLHQVGRDMLGVEETSIQLPSWMGRGA